MSENLVDLVFEGGGVKGIGLGGAFQAIEEAGFKPNNVAGTSAGAITAALVAAGYTAAELKDIVFNMPFPRFKDSGGLARIPFFGGPINVLKDVGAQIDTGADVVLDKSTNTLRLIYKPVPLALVA